MRGKGMINILNRTRNNKWISDMLLLTDYTNSFPI